MTADARAFRLSDGRRLSYFDFGDPQGIPVLYFHGSGACSGAYAQYLDGTASAGGIRIVAPDRPGFGLSDHQPGRTVLDWPRDVAELTAHLEWKRFAVVTESGGSAYGLACARLMPASVDAVAVVSGICPPAMASPVGAMPPAGRLMFGLMTGIPSWLLRKMFQRLEREVKLDPASFLRKAARKAAAAESEILRSESFRHIFQASVMHAFRGGYDGAVADFRLASGRWGFDLRDIARPVRLWHGEADASAPPAMARGIQSLIPGCQATFFPGEGHASVLLLHAGEILRHLVQARERAG